MCLNNNINPKIVWQKWFDPLGTDDIENTDLDFKDDYDYEEKTYNDSSLYEENEDKAYKPSVKVIMTPMGIIPYNENTASSKIFNFWIGHTNFDISAYICSLIQKQPGVETLDIFTRYRFRIGIGKLFDQKEIMLNINQIVYNFLDNHTD